MTDKLPMTPYNRKKSFLQDTEFEELETSQLLELLNGSLILEKGRALFELARRSETDSDLLATVLKEIRKLENKSTRAVGIVSISFLGIAGLLESNNEQIRKVAVELVAQCEEPDRSNLIDFLDDLST